MKSILLALLLFVNSSCAPVTKSAVPTKPVSVHEVVEKSVVRVTANVIGTINEMSVCTGFSIGTQRYLTAAHCVKDLYMEDGIPFQLTMRVNGHVASAVTVDDELDLAVLVSDLNKPALQLRADGLERFEPVYAMGYGHGFTEPLVTEHHALLFGYLLRPDIWPGTVYMNPFIGGMSGGPVYDKDGKVVGIVQRASTYVGYSVSLETIKGFLGV